MVDSLCPPWVHIVMATPRNAKSFQGDVPKILFFTKNLVFGTSRSLGLFRIVINSIKHFWPHKLPTGISGGYILPGIRCGRALYQIRHWCVHPTPSCYQKKKRETRDICQKPHDMNPVSKWVDISPNQPHQTSCMRPVNTQNRPIHPYTPSTPHKQVKTKWKPKTNPESQIREHFQIYPKYYAIWTNDQPNITLLSTYTSN